VGTIARLFSANAAWTGDPLGVFNHLLCLRANH